LKPSIFGQQAFQIKKRLKPCASAFTQQKRTAGFAVRMKLGAQTRTQAVVMGVQAGIINIDL